MDKQKSLLNVAVSMMFRLLTMGLSILVKRLLIQYCGNEVNGLNALYLSLIGFLSVAELGVGSAISFCMYRPIVEGNVNQVAALYQLFRRIYLIIAAVILCAGLMITPFIHIFSRDYTEINVNLYSTFVLMLISVVITYLFSSKISLINAYKNNYITTAISSGGIVFQYILQIATLITTQSFEGYLACRIVSALVQWVITEVVARKKYARILCNKQKIDDGTKRILTKSIRAMFMHKIGTLLVNTVDSVVISFFVGVVALGEYSNYTSILSSMTGLLSLVFSSLVSVVGHLYVEKSRKTTLKYCEAFYLLNYVIGVVFFLGYYAIIDNLVALFFEKSLVVEKSISFVITINGFVQFMRHDVLLFRDATGTFYNDRWKPLIEGLINIILSVLLVKRVGVTGVIIATIITNLVICHVVEPYVLYKNAFDKTPYRYYVKNYSMIGVFIVGLLLLSSLMQSNDSQVAQLLVNGCISVVISVGICVVAVLGNKNMFRHLLKVLKKGKSRQ